MIVKALCCVGGGGRAGVEPRRGEVRDGRQAAVHTADGQQLATRPHHQAEPHQRHARHARQGERIPTYHIVHIGALSYSQLNTNYEGQYKSMNYSEKMVRDF